MNNNKIKHFYNKSKLPNQLQQFSDIWLNAQNNIKNQDPKNKTTLNPENEGKPINYLSNKIKPRS